MPTMSNQPWHVRYLEGETWREALEILREASAWSSRFGTAIWRPDELTEARQRESAEACELVGGFAGDAMTACMRLERSDPVHWPQDTPGEALYLHKLAIRRAFAGRGWPRRMVDWAVAECAKRGARALRLDTAPDTKLPVLYAEMGFRLVERVPRWFVGRRLVRMELMLRPTQGNK